MQEYTDQLEDIDVKLREGLLDANEIVTEEGNIVPLIFMAVMKDNPGAVRALAEHGARLSDGYAAAAVTGSMNYVELITELGGDINSPASEGSTPLFWAVRTGNPEMVRKFLELGADVNAKAKSDYNIMMLLAMLTTDDEGDFPGDVVHMFVEAGADCREALTFAVKAGNVKFIEAVRAEGVSLDFMCPIGSGLLVYALVVHNGTLRLLLELGADPNVQDDKGETPLMRAVSLPEIDLDDIESLLEFGADVNARDKDGMNALMWLLMTWNYEPDMLLPSLVRTGAARCEGWELWYTFAFANIMLKDERHLMILRRLIEHGTDLAARNTRGVNAMMCALMNNDIEAAEIIRAASNRRIAE